MLVTELAIADAIHGTVVGERLTTPSSATGVAGAARAWRAEYRNLIKLAIDTHTEDFNEASPFRNIKKLNTKWQSE